MAGPTSATVEITGGALSISAPTDAGSLGTTANTVAGTTISGQLGEVQVNDARSAAAGSGWVASVTSTAFTPPSGPTIAASAVGYTANDIVKVGTATYTANDPADLTGVSPAVTATGITGDNSATWNPTINLAVPVAWPQACTPPRSPTRSSSPMVPATAAEQPMILKRRTITLRWSLLAGCLLAVASLLPAPASARADDARGSQGPGGIGVRLLDAPAATAGDPRAALYIIDHLAPGTTIERRIEVTNTTAARAAIRMYAAGASIDNSTFLGDASHSPNELSTWNTVRPDTLDLDSGAQASVTVTITVPGDAAPGERYAVVWAEVRSDATPDSGVEQINLSASASACRSGQEGHPPRTSPSTA